MSELVAAAGALFAQRGFVATTTAAIAKTAKVSERTLFWYYPSKDHLLIAVLEAEFARLVGGLRAGGWPTGDLVDDWFRMLVAMREVRHLLPVVHERAESSTVVAEIVSRFNRTVVGGLDRQLAAAGVPAHQRRAAIDIIACCTDGALLRHVDESGLRTMCETLIAALALRSPSPR